MNELPEISKEDLVDYTMDKRLSEGLGGIYNFLPAIFVVVLVVFLLLMIFGRIQFMVGFVAVALSFAGCLTTLLKRMKLQPNSPYTGKPIARYRYMSSPPHTEEVVYIDEEMKRYWIETFRTPSSD